MDIREKLNGNLKYVLIALFAGGSGFGGSLLRGNDDVDKIHKIELQVQRIEINSKNTSDDVKELKELIENYIRARPNK